MNRIEARLNSLKEKGEKAFITYMTAGLPDMETTKNLLKAQEEAGIDIIELGIPFSDPTADGPVIQDASYRSILKGTNLKKIFTALEESRKDGLEVPVIFMMYYNTLMHYGLDAFVEKCAQIGVDGLIIPDLPYEEQEQLNEALAKVENAPISIQLVSPVSKQRIPMIVKNARGFIYCVSTMGVTGQGGNFYGTINDYLKSVKDASDIPVMMGFGIRTAKDIEPMKDIIDGAIVGSHFINLMEENKYDLEVAKDYVRTFKKEMNQ
jgi:tryptophan synthase alpha chain